MKNKKQIKIEKISDKSNDKNAIIYKCEKCGYESAKTFLSIFEHEEFRYCLKCVNKFYSDNFPKANLKK